MARASQDLSGPVGSEWGRYTVRGEEFSVSLPTLPATTIRDVWLEKLKRTRREVGLAAYAGGVVYVVQGFENLQNESLDDFIKKFPDSSASATTREVQGPGFRGKEFTTESEDQRGRSQYIITARHLYRFLAVGSKLKQPEIGIDRFFSLLSLDKNARGIELTDNPGEQQEPDPSDSNMAPQKAKEVTLKARLFFKPEPTYTEEARRNQITGTVILKGVFSSSGAVTNIRLVTGLPFGLSDRAIAVAKQLRFIPAIKDGHFVSQWVQLEYNFTLY